MTDVLHITPSREAFLQHAQEGNLIPVYREILADFETPLSAYRKIRSDGEAFLCESVEGGEHLSRYSFVGCNPRGIIRQDGDQVQVVEGGKVTATYTVSREPGEHHVRDGLEVVERVLGRYRAVDLPGLPRFTGGAMGFVGYEFIHDVEPVVPRPPKDELGTPTMYFLIADELLIFDRVRQTVTILVNAIIEEGAKPEDAYDDAVEEVDRLVSLLEQPLEHRPVSLAAEPPAAPFESNMEKDAFLANVAKSKEYIRAGDIIQVVGSQRFSTEVKADPLDVYRAVRSINPSPYMFLLELDGFSLVGASPEIHVRSEEGQVQIRPIAGTRPRGKTAEEDVAHEKDLLANSIYSYKENQFTREKRLSDLPQSYSKVVVEGIGGSAETLPPIHYYNQTNVELVAETMNRDDGDDTFLITEKTVKPISMMHPFFVMSNCKFLYNLKQYGFKTFGEHTDESYDSEEDVTKRASIITENMARLKGKSIKFYNQTKAIREHNLVTLQHVTGTYKTRLWQTLSQLWKNL